MGAAIGSSDVEPAVRYLNNVRFGSKADMTGEFVMSALPPKADIAKRRWDVRFVLKADKVRRSKNCRFRKRSGIVWF